MRQPSTRTQSRQQWKQNATERAEHHRYLRKELERLRQERDLAKQALNEAKKPRRHQEGRPAILTAQRVWLALTLFAGARISFRAVSRVLHGLADWLDLGKAPCPQTVINWVMRLSMVRLQSVTLLQGTARHLLPCTNGLIWMLDTSITLGTGKLRSVLVLDAHMTNSPVSPRVFTTGTVSRSRCRPPGPGNAWQTCSSASSRWWAARRPPAKMAAASCTEPQTCCVSAAWAAR